RSRRQIHLRAAEPLRETIALDAQRIGEGICVQTLRIEAGPRLISAYEVAPEIAQREIAQRRLIALVCGTLIPADRLVGVGRYDRGKFEIGIEQGGVVELR